MSEIRILVSADTWLLQLFSAKSARQGGIVRRSVLDVERIVGRDQFRVELLRRAFNAVVNSGQYVIFCNNAPVHVVC